MPPIETATEHVVGTSTLRRIGDSAALAILAGEGSSRLFTFLFFAWVARGVSPSSFGVFRLSVLVASMACLFATVLGMLAAREFAAERNREPAVRELRTATLLTLGACVVLGLAAVCVAAGLGFAKGWDLAGTCAVLIGFAVLQVYYGVYRGVGWMRFAAICWAGAAAMELIMWVPVRAFGGASARSALIVYGLSSVAVVAVAEVLADRPTRPFGPATRARLARYGRLGWPLALSSGIGLAWTSVDLLWLQATDGSGPVGEYGAARNLAIALSVVPLALSSYVVPEASYRSVVSEVAARRFVFKIAGVSLVASAVIAGVLYVGAPSVMSLVYGHAYAGGATALRIHCAGFVGYALLGVLTAGAVGLGRIRIPLLAASGALLVSFVLAATLDPGVGSAAWVYVGGQFSATLITAGMLALPRVREPSS
jgi:O-antigen/teichoic acid export membrane protein